MKYKKYSFFQVNNTLWKYSTFMLLILFIISICSCTNLETKNIKESNSISLEEHVENQVELFESPPTIEQQDNKDVSDDDVSIDLLEKSNQQDESMGNINFVRKGDYIYFGNYLGEPILWRIVKIDENQNIMLMAETILTFKPYDAAESGKFGFLKSGEGYLDRGISNLEFREFNGSGTWYDSNLRDWLNSEDYIVKFITFPPNEESVGIEGMEYSQEPGFLTGFKSSEISLVQISKIKSIVTIQGLTELDGGNESYTIVGNEEMDIDSISSNYEKAYYKVTNDKVFILSVEELVELNKEYNLQRYPTISSINEHKVVTIYKDDLYDYWTRTSCDIYPNEVYVYNAKNKYFGSFESPAQAFDIGVVPALWLTNEAFEFFTCDGTIDNPYHVVISD